MAITRPAENRGPKNQEPDGMAAHGGQENAAVKRHDGEHDKVGQAHPDGVHDGAEHPREGDVALGGGGVLDDLAAREPLDEDGGEEDDEEGDGVLDGAGARPAVEEDLGVLAPEEGHVHHHHLPVRGRRRRRHGCSGSSAHVHAVHFSFFFGCWKLELRLRFCVYMYCVL